MYLVKWDYYR